MEEPLPPTDRVLSGLDGEFKAQESGSEESDKSPEEASGDEKEGEEGGGAEEGDKADEGEQEDETEEEEPKPVIELKTASHDPRFPSTNQVHHHNLHSFGQSHV